MGCNEVPKAGGGTYWADTENKHRDFELGFDPNQRRRDEILFDLVNRMSQEGMLSQELMEISEMKDRVERIILTPKIRDAQAMDTIEFGRIIHAEMSAISDAARLGRSIKDGILYCTTFPCHMCAKHIVAAGVKRVVFLEPYPKSYAHELHSDSITFESSDSKKVLFQPFIGLSPRRYRDIFEKRKRKASGGLKKDWYNGAPMPMIEDRGPSYIENEAPFAFSVLSRFRSDPSGDEG